ncbi:MAG: hypothetical protein AAFY71_24800 [Bacteroidota bacterium]
MKKILSLLTFVIPVLIWANGGPVDWGLVAQTGEIKLMEASGVKLKSEKLDINIIGSYAYVHVSYILTSETDQQVGYGFPVDLISDPDYGTNEWEENQLPWLTMTLDGKLLPTEMKKKEELKPTGLLFPTDNKENYQPESGMRYWFMSQIKFMAGQEQELIVRYKAKVRFSDWETSKSIFRNYSKRFFQYDMSPAAGWGDGTIGSLEVSLQTWEASNAQLTGKQSFQKANGGWTWKEENVKLDNDSRFSIYYEVEEYAFTDFINRHGIKNLSSRLVKVSSTLGDAYSKDNLFDGDLKTAWVEGSPGLGIGETIELDPYYFKLGAILIVPGYHKSKKAYEQNARPKKVSIELKLKGKTSWNEPLLVELEDTPYQPVQGSNFGKLCQTLHDFGDIGLEAEKIRITVKEVYPGTKFKDLCISEIFLIKYPW